ncbi:MAG: CotH kinase family protein [Spirochaetales bacterium]|nr:CotH kinase family protein [Spirochaetales bacterium]
MGNKTISPNLKIFFLLYICIFFHCCGEFLGFSSLPEPDLGTIKKIRLYLSPDSLKKLYNTVINDTYVPCFYEEDSRRIEGFIKIRGLSTRIYPKKSFTVKLNVNNKIERYVIKTFSLKNRIAFFAYNRVGLGVPETEGAALFINDEYIGCYTKIKLYNEEDLRNKYYDIPGELFSCHFNNMGSDVPLHSLSEKKFPDDNNFIRLQELIYNAKYMDDEEWSQWTDTAIDKDQIVKYMIVHDFLGITDTYRQNFHIYAHKSLLLLPWDNELGMDIQNLPAIGGNNLLTIRLLQEPSMKYLYNEYMKAYFLNPGENNITEDLINELDRIHQETDKAVFNEPAYYITYDEFLRTITKIRDFVSNRYITINDPPLQ